MVEQVEVAAAGLDTNPDIQELRRKLITMIAVALLPLSTAAAWFVFPHVLHDARPFLVFFSLVITASAILRLRHRYLILAEAVLVLGPTLSLVFALKAIHSPVVPYFAALCVTASSTVNPPLGLISALLTSSSLILLRPGDAHLIPVLALLWLTAGLAWTSSRGLYMALEWAWSSQQRASHLLGQVRDRQGRLNQILTALTEATRRLERMNHELVVARRQADEARHIKSQFAANISHELRTPLNLIVGFSEMLHRSPEVYGSVRWTPELRADIREIYQSGQHLMSMINDILDLARIEAHRLPLKLEATDLGELIRQAIATTQGLLRGKPVALHTRIAPDLPEVLVDCARIRQVLLNLLSNAARFTDEGNISISAEAKDGEVLVSVSDTGVGIPPDQLPVIFQEFSQAREAITSGRGGTGLGLAICRQFVNLHGGMIQAESRLGEGSTFRFTLPLPGSGRAYAGISYYAPEGWSPPVPENPLGKTALVVGRNTDACTALGRAVTGYRTIPLNNIAALSSFVENEHPAAIISLQDQDGTEISAPDGFWQAAGRIDLPLIRCGVPLTDPERSIPGVASYLLKPVARESLVAAIEQHAETLQSLLVVDDDPGFVALVRRIVAAELGSIRVRSAYSGEVALGLLAEEEYDLVILDLVMPGVDGFQVLEKMRRDARWAGIPVLVTTASGSLGNSWQRPCSIEVLRGNRCNTALIGRYLNAILEVAPPDYSGPAPLAEPRASAAETLAS